MVASDTMNIAKRFTSIFAVVAVSALLGAAEITRGGARPPPPQAQAVLWLIPR